MPKYTTPRGMPSRPTRAPAQSGLGPVKIVRGIVGTVDPKTYTATVYDEDGEGHPIPDVSVTPLYVNSDGGGMYWMPEEGSPVWLMYPSADRKPVVLAGCSLPSQLDEGDDAEDPSDYRMNRPVINPGDIAFRTRDENFMVLRRGGVLEMGATQAAQRIFAPLGNLIRDFAEKYELVTTGGSMEFKNRRNNEDDQERTPIEWALQVKEFAQDELPKIDIRLGRIQEEDDEFVVNGGNVGGIVARVIINNRYRLWIDRDGNMQSYTHGSQTHSHYGAVRTRYHQNFFERVGGIRRGVLGSRDIQILRGDTLTIDSGGREELITGGYKQTVEGPVTRSWGTVQDDISGDTTRDITGSSSTTVTADHNLVVGGNMQHHATLARHETVGTRWTLTVNNGQADPLAIDVGNTSLSGGEARIYNVLGKLKLIAGPPDAAVPIGEIQLKPTGAIVISTLGTLANIEVNQFGVQIATPSGDITIDAAGTVNLGPSVGGLGNVVTTLTHPVDLITGTPILGSASVRASGAPAPGPSTLPSTFLNDNT